MDRRKRRPEHQTGDEPLVHRRARFGDEAARLAGLGDIGHQGFAPAPDRRSRRPALPSPPLPAEAGCARTAGGSRFHPDRRRDRYSGCFPAEPAAATENDVRIRVVGANRSGFAHCRPLRALVDRHSGGFSVVRPRSASGANAGNPHERRLCRTRLRGIPAGQCGDPRSAEEFQTFGWARRTAWPTPSSAHSNAGLPAGSGQPPLPTCISRNCGRGWRAKASTAMAGSCCRRRLRLGQRRNIGGWRRSSRAGDKKTPPFKGALLVCSGGGMLPLQRLPLVASSARRPYLTGGDSLLPGIMAVCTAGCQASLRSSIRDFE